MTAVDNNAHGVTHDIIRLYTDLRIEENTALTARSIIKILASAEFASKKVQYKEEQCQKSFEGTKITAKFTLARVLAESVNSAWTYKKELDKTRDTFITPMEHNEAHFMWFSALETAQNFQVR